ncbi:hypothetical protein DENIS_0026 [Desulfonema ishimotonii]|uniref:PilZ domain-containing protein n=1 Tax=Desulfonema ishimotonii TaxID=45657 RepID=A0A401FQ28_9BACT|nr:PilZ domain-containing protein [Desulfonema ishimotonii]GBC59096.1 hypothetical protein DENIS_0026 [Desulfonema ishimotonii]
MKSLKFEVEGKVYYTTRISREDMKENARPREKSWIEFRQFPRKSHRIPIDYVSDDRAFNDLLRDISVSGIFIETRHLFSVGQELFLLIPFSEKAKNVKVRGEIVRVAPDGIGVRFRRRGRMAHQY